MGDLQRRCEYATSQAFLEAQVMEQFYINNFAHTQLYL